MARPGAPGASGAWASASTRPAQNPAAAADERWLVMHLTALSEKRSLSTILLRRAAVVAIRKRLKRPLALDDAEFEAFLKACAGPRAPGRCARRRCSSPTCAPPPWC